MSNVTRKKIYCVGSIVPALLLAMIVSSVQSAPAPATRPDTVACPVQLISQDHKTPVSNDTVSIRFHLEGTSVGGDTVHSDEQGMIDLAPLREVWSDLAKKYGDRLKADLWCDETSIPIPPEVWNRTGAPTRLEMNLGSLPVTAQFVGENGKPLPRPLDCFPAELKEYLNTDDNGWFGQIRLYEMDDQGQEGREVYNYLRVDPTGQFQVNLKTDRSYKLDMTAYTDLMLMNATFHTGKIGSNLRLVVKPKPYCLYGNFIDATTRTPTTENIDITGLGAYFFNSAGKSKYALFFNAPETIDITVGSYIFQKTYLEQKVSIKVEQKLQRQDFELVPLAGSATTIKYRVKITGITLKEPSDVYLNLSGDGYFVQQGQSIGDNTYEFTLPHPGHYQLQVFSPRFAFPEIMPLQIDREMTLEVKGAVKDTWLIVKVVDADGKPIGFPQNTNWNVDEPAANCVILVNDTLEAINTSYRRRYLNREPADVGSALRPDEKGQVKFLLSDGGKYFLQADLNGFQKSSLRVEVKPHEATTAVMKLGRTER